MQLFLLITLILNTCLYSFAQQTKINKLINSDKINTTNTLNTKQKSKKTIDFNGVDGPYIINDTLHRINSENKLTTLPIVIRDSILVSVDNEDADSFYISLRDPYKIPKTTYNLPKKMVVISDIEGNYNAFVSFLFSNKIIDKNNNWIYNEGHLVLVGDFVDRGENVTQVLWLIYKLEHQAQEQNGHVHFILGNHEILNFDGDHKYNRGKYIKAAQAISGIKDKKEATKYLYSTKSELGKWLNTKNVVEMIGDYIFVHGGLSPDILDYKLSLDEINNLVRLRYGNLKNPDDDALNFLYSLRGPFWYRGLVMKRYRYSKITKPELENILKYYNSKKIIIGHTPTANISTDFDGAVIKLDVIHGTKKNSGDTKGLLIEDGIEYIIDDICRKEILKH